MRPPSMFLSSSPGRDRSSALWPIIDRRSRNLQSSGFGYGPARFGGNARRYPPWKSATKRFGALTEAPSSSVRNFNGNLKSAKDQILPVKRLLNKRTARSLHGSG